MALLFTDGFDVGDVAIKWNAVTGGMSSITSTRFNYGRAVQCGGGGQSMRRFFTPAAQSYIGMAVANVYAGANVPFAYLYSDAGLSLQLYLYCTANGGVAVYRGGTQIAVSGPGLLSSGWHYVELGAKIDPAVGTIDLRVDGISVATFNGNTKNSGTSNQLDCLVLTNSASTYACFDDVYICDSTGTANNNFLGDIRVQTLKPSASGTFTQLTPTGVANNWDNVNEIPYSNTDYNSSSTSGQRDTYQFDDLLVGTGSVKGVQTNVVAYKSDAGSGSLKTVVRSGGTVYSDATIATNTNPTTFSTVREVDPATSNAWTPTNVNNIEAGVEIV